MNRNIHMKTSLIAGNSFIKDNQQRSLNRNVQRPVQKYVESSDSKQEGPERVVIWSHLHSDMQPYA